MTREDTRRPDWDPRSENVLCDQRASYDEMREHCPVAYSEFMQWSLFRHEDIVHVLHDPDTFSNAVSRHLSVPNGMDPPEHTAYRRVIEPYFSPERMRAFEPSCRRIVAELVEEISESDTVELMSSLARPFAARVQCAFLGWPPELHELLIRWTKKNYEATRAQDRAALSEFAREFEGLVDEMVEARVQSGATPQDDITTSLMHETVGGRTLSNEEITSILRNWTVGEVGTISAAVGILVHFLTQHPELQEQLRAGSLELSPAIDEVLRIYGPLVSNRRVTTRAVEIEGRKIGAGEELSLMWISANRDGCVFEDPHAFRLDREPTKNLLYGAGIHACPGAPLARMELRVVMEELFERTTWIESVPDRSPTNVLYPASGLASLPVSLRAE